MTRFDILEYKGCLTLKQKEEDEMNIVESKSMTKKFGNFDALRNINLIVKKDRYMVLLVQMVPESQRLFAFYWDY